MDETDVEADARTERKDALHPVGPDVVGVADVCPAPHSAHVGQRKPLAAERLASVALKPHRIRGFACREVASRPHVVFRLAAAVEVGEDRPELAPLLAFHAEDPAIAVVVVDDPLRKCADRVGIAASRRGAYRHRRAVAAEPRATRAVEPPRVDVASVPFAPLADDLAPVFKALRRLGTVGDAVQGRDVAHPFAVLRRARGRTARQVEAELDARAAQRLDHLARNVASVAGRRRDAALAARDALERLVRRDVRAGVLSEREEEVVNSRGDEVALHTLHVELPRFASGDAGPVVHKRADLARHPVRFRRRRWTLRAARGPVLLEVCAGERAPEELRDVRRRVVVEA